MPNPVEELKYFRPATFGSPKKDDIPMETGLLTYEDIILMGIKLRDAIKNNRVACQLSLAARRFLEIAGTQSSSEKPSANKVTEEKDPSQVEKDPVSNKVTEEKDPSQVEKDPAPNKVTEEKDPSQVEKDPAPIKKAPYTPEVEPEDSGEKDPKREPGRFS